MDEGLAAGSTEKQPSGQKPAKALSSGWGLVHPRELGEGWGARLNGRSYSHFSALPRKLGKPPAAREGHRSPGRGRKRELVIRLAMWVMRCPFFFIRLRSKWSPGLPSTAHEAVYLTTLHLTFDCLPCPRCPRTSSSSTLSTNRCSVCARCAVWALFWATCLLTFTLPCSPL